jgi:Uncharacterized protein conserved in bacteria (DUF2252)
VWYASVSEDDLRAGATSNPKAGRHPEEVQRGERAVEKARTRDSLQAQFKLGDRVDGTYRIVSRPPLVVPLRDLATSHSLSRDEVEPLVREQFLAYRRTLPDDRRLLLDRFDAVDMARKVVGVGSVGTWAFIVLLQVATTRTRCSSRSRRRRRRCWRTTCPGADARSTASASSRVSG